jgi:hypothetical protein
MIRSRLSLLENRQGSGRNAAVDGHEIDPHPSLVFDVFKDGLLRKILAGQTAREESAYRTVDGHRTDHDGGVLDDSGENNVDVAARREVHDGIRPGIDRDAQFVELLRKEGMACRSPDVGVDFCRKTPADRPGFKDMRPIFRDHHGAGRHPTEQFLRGYTVVVCRLHHFRCDVPFFCRFELCHVPDLLLNTKAASLKESGLNALCISAHFPTQALP